jgi:hypothetical protein
MPWLPRYKLIPVEVLIDNVKAVFVRDIAAAIDYFQGAYTLPDYQTVGSAARTLGGPWPRLNILPGPGEMQESDDGARVGHSADLIIETETVGRQSDLLARHLTRYVAASKSVLYEMSEADLVGTIKSTTPQFALLSWDVGSERYAERFYESETLYTQVGSVVLTVNYLVGR